MVGALFTAGPSPAPAAGSAAVVDLDCAANTFCLWAAPNPTTDPDMTWTPGTGKVRVNDTVYRRVAAWKNSTAETVCLFSNAPSGPARTYIKPGSWVSDATESDDTYVTDVGPVDPSTGWCVEN